MVHIVRRSSPQSYRTGNSGLRRSKYAFYFDFLLKGACARFLLPHTWKWIYIQLLNLIIYQFNKYILKLTNKQTYPQNLLTHKNIKTHNDPKRTRKNKNPLNIPTHHHQVYISIISYFRHAWFHVNSAPWCFRPNCSPGSSTIKFSSFPSMSGARVMVWLQPHSQLPTATDGVS